MNYYVLNFCGCMLSEIRIMRTLRGQYLHLSVFYVNFVFLEFFWSVSTVAQFTIWNPVYFVFETVFISVDRSLNWLVLEVSMQSLSPDENPSIVSIGFDYISPGSCVDARKVYLYLGCAGSLHYWPGSFSSLLPSISRLSHLWHLLVWETRSHHLKMSHRKWSFRSVPKVSLTCLSWARRWSNILPGWRILSSLWTPADERVLKGSFLLLAPKATFLSKRAVAACWEMILLSLTTAWYSTVWKYCTTDSFPYEGVFYYTSSHLLES